MRQLLVLFLGIFSGLWVFSAEGPPAIKAYKDWKASKVQVIQTKMGQTKAQIDNLKLLKSQDSKGTKLASYESLLKRYEQDFSQAQWNLEVAKDLSVTDYVVLYLASQPSKGRFQEAANQLNHWEVAELLEAYSEALGAANPPSAAGAAALSGTPLKSGSTGLLSK